MNFYVEYYERRKYFQTLFPINRQISRTVELLLGTFFNIFCNLKVHSSINKASGSDMWDVP